MSNYGRNCCACGAGGDGHGGNSDGEGAREGGRPACRCGGRQRPTNRSPPTPYAPTDGLSGSAGEGEREGEGETTSSLEMWKKWILDLVNCLDLQRVLLTVFTSPLAHLIEKELDCDVGDAYVIL